MTLLKRITATLKANVENVVDQIENQDAVVEAAVGEMRRATAKAKVRLARVRNDREEMEQKITELGKAEKQWRQRARDNAKSDEDTALACLARSKQCHEKRETLKIALARHTEAEAQLEEEVRRAEDRVESMARQRNLMRSRQSAADAVKTTQEWNEQGPIDVDAVFERWESRILETEMISSNIDIDPLEQRFTHDEQKAELRAELKALVGSKKKEQNND